MTLIDFGKQVGVKLSGVKKPAGPAAVGKTGCHRQHYPKAQRLLEHAGTIALCPGDKKRVVSQTGEKSAGGIGIGHFCVDARK
jgi:hypothetical protein